jgi:hypothetical protein
MTNSSRHPKIKLVFETTSLRIPLADIETLREVSGAVRNSMKYGQIAASIHEVGIIDVQKGPPIGVEEGPPLRI